MRVLPFGILSAVTIVAATVLVSATQATQPSVPDRSHYIRLAAFDGAPAPGRADLDSQQFPLTKWGDLYNWRLLKPHYVTVPIESFTTLTVPANSSPQTRAELDYLLDVYRDAMIYIIDLKLQYARPRPHHIDARIQAEDKIIPHGSFPSGHSFASHINAGVLARLAPPKRSELFTRAHELAWSRELLGVHYPSDSEAGRVLAEDFVRFLFQSREFMRDFSAVQREWQDRGIAQ